MAAPLIHIGYHKTGSTWLQRNLFVNAAQGYCTPWGRLTVIQSDLVTPNALDFHPDAVRDRLAPRLEQAGREGLVPVITSERLSGSPHSGGFDSAMLARRLQAVFPEARILIVIREQRSAIRSSYGQYVKEGGAVSLRRYLRPPKQGVARFPAFERSHFRYDRLIRLYLELFGPERVLALPFEWFRAEPEAFLEAIGAFAGVRATQRLSELPLGQSPNRSYSALCAPLLRRWNWLTADDRMNPSAVWPHARLHAFGRRGVFWFDDHFLRFWADPLERAWRAEIERLCADYYDESNRRTAQLVHHPLDGFGYAGL